MGLSSPNVAASAARGAAASRQSASSATASTDRQAAGARRNDLEPVGVRRNSLEPVGVRRVVAIVPPWDRRRGGTVAPAPEDRIGRAGDSAYRLA